MCTVLLVTQIMAQQNSKTQPEINEEPLDNINQLIFGILIMTPIICTIGCMFCTVTYVLHDHYKKYNNSVQCGSYIA